MPLHFELVTPERLVRSEDVHMVVVPGSEGDFGVLAGHAPFMSTMRNGDLEIYRTNGGAAERIRRSGVTSSKCRAIFFFLKPLPGRGGA